MVDCKASVKGSLVAAVVGVAISGLTLPGCSGPGRDAATVNAPQAQPVNVPEMQLPCSEQSLTYFNFKTATPDDVARCLEDGANIEAMTNAKWTPLHLAVIYSDSPAVVKILLDAGANLEAINLMGFRPLHMAVRSSESPEIIKVLLDAGANLEALTAYGRGTPLASGGRG